MLPPLLEKTAGTPRDTWLWALIGFLVVGQMAAFWMLCQYQVRKAEVRDASLQMERLAMADCMKYIPKATMTSCAARVAAQPDGVARPTTVSFAVR
jgi:hypothetical protein